ncbi:hypothetical protein C0995_007055 [Termitomyces sp. Mi166|nr:hypothetical protein C0995_007055 [Termitomyces sp. Mi166\
MSGGLSTFAGSISVTMISRLMLNLHEKANTGIYSTTTNVTSTNMEYLTPSAEIELDTIGTGDMYHTVSVIAPVQTFRLNEENAPAEPSLSSPPQASTLTTL